MNEYDSTMYYSSQPTGAEAGIVAALFGFYLLFIVVVYIVHAFLLGMVFKKAGIPTWKAWVPIYNSWILLELGGQPGWWILLAFVPFINIVAAVFMIIAMYHIGLKFQKEGWFVLLAIIVPTVWLAWLAFDKSTWQGQRVAPQNDPQPAA